MSRPTAQKILVVTRIWPTADRPSLGSFVRNRVRGLAHVGVVHPGPRPPPWPLLYLAMFGRALTTPGIAGIEAHVVVPTGLVGWAVARLRRIPIVVYSHGGDVRDWRRLPAPRRWATRFVVGHVDRVVTNSADTAGWIRQLGSEPVLAPPGIDLARFAPAARPHERRVLYLGGRNPRKGWHVARDLADTLVGPWLREVDPAEVPDLIRAHDVVLVPSVDEPFGIVALEAIACGRWVVANDVGGLREIVVDGVNGTLVRDGDFAAALARMPDYDPFTVARSVEAYSVERWQARLDEIWSDVLARAER